MDQSPASYNPTNRHNWTAHPAYPRRRSLSFLSGRLGERSVSKGEFDTREDPPCHRRGLPMIAASMLILGGVFSGSVSAGELSRILRSTNPTADAGQRGHAAGNLGRNSDALPLPGAPQSAPWYGYGFGVPTYSWGWFGVKYRPAVTCHRGYYDDFYQWGYRQGY